MPQELPSLSAMRRRQVLPPEPDDIDRLIQIQRKQNERDTWDERLAGGVIGALEGFTGLGSVEGTLPSARHSPRGVGRFVGEAAGILPDLAKGGAGLAVAFGAGTPKFKELIAQMKREGAEQVSKIGAEGLERRSLGMRPRQMPETEEGRKAPITEWSHYPNTPLKQEQLEALQLAQQRWPRLFGHIRDIGGIDAMTQLSNPLASFRGSMRELTKKTPKLSALALDPEHANVETVGHELQHLRDRLVDPNFTKKYQEDKEKLGYANLPQEKKANEMGKRFGYIYKEYKRRGNQAKDAFGRNFRMRKGIELPEE